MIWDFEQGFVSVLTVFSPGMQVQQKLIPPSKSSTYMWLRCHPWKIKTDTRVIAATNVMKQNCLPSHFRRVSLHPILTVKSREGSYPV